MENESRTQQLCELEALVAREHPEHVLVVTGAGISAASGIPTFRGPEGYWTVGSKQYRPQEMATQVAFRRMPREVWRWYLFRKGICNAAEPNAGHFALVELERTLGDRFTLVTQNVDGLHLRAGNSLERTLQVHGNTDYMRGIQGDETPLSIPEEIHLGSEDALSDEVWEQLVTDDGRAARPHVLWFDEHYREDLYRSDSALLAAERCDLLIVVGTSGAAAIPYHIAATVLERGAAIIDINPELDPFAEHARERAAVGKGLWLEGGGAQWLPPLVDLLREQRP